MASPDNPLTARVMVNRVWQHHFGEGIVRSTNNFGKLGERPTHPELLDYLADRFVKLGWSIKALHREIMLSATYQQSSIGDADSAAQDPDNRLLGRANRWRLESEAIRDNLLAVAGRLDRCARRALDARFQHSRAHPLFDDDSFGSHRLRTLVRRGRSAALGRRPHRFDRGSPVAVSDE